MKKNTLKPLYDFLDSFIDVISTSYANTAEILETAQKQYEKTASKDAILKEPYNEKKYILEKLSELSSKDTEKVIENVTLFKDIICNIIKLSCGAKQALFLVAEAQALTYAYRDSYDEDDYIEILPEILSTRKNRILMNFNELSPAEIEAEYLLLYNAYTSKLRYTSVLEEEFTKIVGEEKAAEVSLKTSERFVEKLDAENVAYLTEWTPKNIHDRKEKFLDIISTMSNEDAKTCYMEMADIWLSIVELTQIYKEEIAAIDNEETLQRVQENTNKVIDEAKDAPDEQAILESITNEEKDVLGDLFNL